MKVLQVIHGYPMRYNAGSEVYTQTLCQALASNNEVHVFTRKEDPFESNYALHTESDPDDPRVTLHVVNIPRNRDRYRDVGVDQRFAEVLDKVKPEIVHVGHLNHLSTSLLVEATSRQIPIVYTLHDYWIMCPRGQFMQTYPKEPDDLWAACDGQQHEKCAERCYARYFSGAPAEWKEDVVHWTAWVARRMQHIREMMDLVDVFIAPSQYLLNRYRDEFGLPAGKLIYLDYGFDLSRFRGRKREAGEPFTFGYIGTHIPAKGIHHLLEAFGRVQGDALLKIWGRPRGQDTDALKALSNGLAGNKPEQVKWLPEYRNHSIVDEVFNKLDAIVVPSIWVENSPLVIHEALQTRIPVITANIGGMAEYVHHEVNGFLFQHRNPASLALQMQRLVDAPEMSERLGKRGYLQSGTGDVDNINDHVQKIEMLYGQVVRHQQKLDIEPRPGPWRITFDTNPDTCNIHCIMCEEHSPYSNLQAERKKASRPHRMMPIELIRRIVADAATKGLREIIPSTMGEPLLYQHFDEFLELCHEHGLKLNLTTNGTFPGRGAAEWAKCIVPVASDVKISWNGAKKETQERIMLGVSWNTMLDNAKAFIEIRDAQAADGGNRCQVTFQLTFLEDNVQELAKIVDLAIDLGVDRVKGHHVWTHFEELYSKSMRRSRESKLRWNRAVVEAHQVAAQRILPTGKSILLENFFEVDESAHTGTEMAGPCPFLGREAWISATGRFDPCCAPDAQRRTLGDFGSLHDQTFSEIWNGESYNWLTRTYSNRSLCRNCNMRKLAEVAL